MKMRVQLKNDLSSDGEVIGKGEVKARWKVRWSEGPLKGRTTSQSSKSLRAWQLDLAGMVEDATSSEDEEEAEPPEVDYAERKRKFDVHADSLKDKEVVVSRYPRFIEFTFLISPALDRSKTRNSARARGLFVNAGPT